MLRRVEHAARHAEILQSFGRLSKSAATSPVATPYLPVRSASREYFDTEVEDDSVMCPRRRASGGWTHDISPHSYGTGSSADGEQRRRNLSNWAPYSQPTSSHTSMFIPSDDSPSPRSTDEELPTPAQLSVPARSAGPYMTPSTSPFLGGLSTLNIHSTQPSRAPSPIMLPPPATRPGSPGDEIHRRRGVPDSPPISFSVGRKRRSSNDYEPHRCAILILISMASSHVPLLCFHTSAPAFQHTFPHQRGFPVNVNHPPSHPHSALSSPYAFTTPTLSSGPSSSGSSPSSHPHSRAPSPPHGHPSHHSHSHHTHSSPFLAHSVRAAFGMTPIHTPGPLPSSAHTNAPNGFAATSMPTSRAGSPPIKLAPLRVPSPSALGAERSSKSPRMGGVALPGFSEVEAAARAL